MAGFHVVPLSWLNWNLEMLVFAEGGKPYNPEKDTRSKTGTKNKLNSHMALDRNRTRATLVEGERPRLCANLAPLKLTETWCQITNLDSEVIKAGWTDSFADFTSFVRTTVQLKG